MLDCLFCNSPGPFNTEEHIIPESLGNYSLILDENVCDKCQNYFGSKVESFVISKTVIGFWRTLAGTKTKSGNLPKLNMKQPEKQKGRIPNIHPLHENAIIRKEKDGSTSIEILDEEKSQNIEVDTANELQFVFTPETFFMIGRFLLKIGLELICLDDPQLARVKKFDSAREYSREGRAKVLDKHLWPIVHFRSGDIKNLKSSDSEGHLNYHGHIEKSQDYFLLHFKSGLDHWITCVNNPWLPPNFYQNKYEEELDFMWYPEKFLT